MLTAIKSEKEALAIYAGLADKIENAVLKDLLKDLAKEEEKHADYLTEAYKGLFPQKEILLPNTTKVPLPSIHIEHEMVHLSEIMNQAMQAELSAHEFYAALSERFYSDHDIKKMLLKLSEMELKHYEILKREKENLQNTEDASIYWDMLHIGV